jgi:tetratricopeptide (TPR) repeat protein
VVQARERVVLRVGQRFAVVARHRGGERALALVGDDGVSREQVAALAVHSRLLMLGSEYQESVEVGTAGLHAARQLGEEGIEANLLITMGTARNRLGQDGMPELEQGVAMADRLNLPREYTRAHNNIGEQLVVDGDFSGAERRYELALERMERLGIVQSEVWLLPQLADLAYIVGDWDAAEQRLGRFYSILETISEHYLETQAGGIRAAMAAARGSSGAGALWETTLESARSVKDPQALGPALTGRARFLLDEGEVDAAAALVEELMTLSELYHMALLDLAWLSHDLGRELEMRPHESTGVWGEAGMLVAQGKLVEAAEFLAVKNMRTHEAYARLRAAEQFASEGRGAEAQPHLERALAFYRSVGASRYIRRGEAVLPASA